MSDQNALLARAEGMLKGAMESAVGRGYTITQFTWRMDYECCALAALDLDYRYMEHPSAQWVKHFAGMIGISADQASAFALGFDGDSPRWFKEMEWAKLGRALWQYAEGKGWTK